MSLPLSFKYKCAERATRDGKIPTTEELKGACVKEMNDNHQDLLQCDVQKILKAAGHTWLWTPPYCPWLQPIETFWAHGKNRAASKNRNGAHSRSRLACESHRSPCPPLLRPDDEAVHGRPPRWLVWQRHLPPVGPRGQTDRQRAGRNGRGAHPGTAPREGSAAVRQGKKPEDDWIPSDCCRPSNVAGLVEKAKGEAEAMITKIDGLSGTLADLVMRQSEAGANGTVTHKWVPNPRFVDPSAKLVAPHTRDMSDLIGLPRRSAISRDSPRRWSAATTSSPRRLARSAARATAQTCRWPPSTATMSCRLARARRPTRTASAAVGGCRSTRPTRSAGGASRCQ